MFTEEAPASVGRAGCSCCVLQRPHSTVCWGSTLQAFLAALHCSNSSRLVTSDSVCWSSNGLFGDVFSPEY